MDFVFRYSAWDRDPAVSLLLGEEGILAMGRWGLVSTQLTIHQSDVQASANVVFHTAHEAGRESREDK